MKVRRITRSLRRSPSTSKQRWLRFASIFGCLICGAASAEAQSIPDWPPLKQPFFPPSSSPAQSPKGAEARPAAAEPLPPVAPAAPALPADPAAPKPPMTVPDGTISPLTTPPPEDIGLGMIDTNLIIAPRRHEISVAADIMLGEGEVTVPVGYSLQEALGSSANVPVDASLVERSSTYYGATISYSFGQNWFFDFSYARGNSSGTVPIDAGFLGEFDSDFEIDDEWYQAYVRYSFPALRGKKLFAYLRAGATYVDAEMDVVSVRPLAAVGTYTQHDESQDILGNVGFGVGYALYTARKFRISLQGEGEGFYGQRSQDTIEDLATDELTFKEATIDNDLMGGLGRGTVRFDYRWGNSGAFRTFIDAGMQFRYTVVDYPDAGSFGELLWGPYARLGIRYAF